MVSIQRFRVVSVFVDGLAGYYGNRLPITTHPAPSSSNPQSPGQPDKDFFDHPNKDCADKKTAVAGEGLLQRNCHSRMF